MSVSGIFNAIMIHPDMYYLLVDIKQNNMLSWKNIYFSIEIASAMVVITNGLFYLVSSVCVCVYWCCGIIRDSTFDNPDGKI